MERITIDEYCQQMSQGSRQVELISGFYHFMKVVAKKPKATRAEYDEAFEAFKRMPA